jgi:hypothetical protein
MKNLEKKKKLIKSITNLRETLKSIGEEIKTEEDIEAGSEWQATLIEFWNKEYKTYLSLTAELERQVGSTDINSEDGDSFPFLYK